MAKMQFLNNDFDLLSPLSLTNQWPYNIMRNFHGD